MKIKFSIIVWNARSLFMGFLYLLATSISIYAFEFEQQNSRNTYQPKIILPSTEPSITKSVVTEFSPPSQKVIPEEQSFSAKNELGQFQPYTDAERELEKMLHGKDENIDLALANWLIVADIPQFRDMKRENYFALLDTMTNRVRQDMELMQKSGWHGINPNDPETRCYRFCSAIIRLRFAYCEEFRQENLTSAQMKALYADANNLFLAGLLRTRRGSCVSMPLIYLVIGRRLGLPVHLVSIGKHYFIRWEEPGYRMNIETTVVNKITITPDDSVYLDIEGITRDRLTGSQLRNMTNREVVGNLFFTRSAYWTMTDVKFETQHCIDLSRARHLSPDDPGISALHQAVFKYYAIKPEITSIYIRIKPK